MSAMLDSLLSKATLADCLRNDWAIQSEAPIMPEPIPGPNPETDPLGAARCGERRQ